MFSVEYYIVYKLQIMKYEKLFSLWNPARSQRCKELECYFFLPELVNFYV